MKLIKYPFIGIKTIIILFLLFTKYFFIGLLTLITIFPYYIINGLKFLFSRKNTNNTPEIEKKIIPITILTLSITTYLISVFILTRWYVQNKRSKNFIEDISSTPTIIEDINSTSNPELNEEPPEEQQQNNTTENQYKDTEQITPAPSTPQAPPQTQQINTNFINVNLNYYIQKNPETVAWLQVNGTKVDYPVVQHTNNEYYLKNDFYKRKTNNGWIFVDYRNNLENFNNNTIIYGHNLINGTMFGTIPKLTNQNWFSNKNNHYIKLSTKNTNSIWQIFSVYTIKPTTDYLQTKFSSTIAYEKFLNVLKERSHYKFNIELNYTDKIITLSTCDNSGTKRIAVHAKLIKIESK